MVAIFYEKKTKKFPKKTAIFCLSKKCSITVTSKEVFLFTLYISLGVKKIAFI
jgi:hypothetical protein